jgi:hypothetical protein
MSGTGLLVSMLGMGPNENPAWNHSLTPAFLLQKSKPNGLLWPCINIAIQLFLQKLKATCIHDLRKQRMLSPRELIQKQF